MKDPKTIHPFLRLVELWATFDIQTDITWAIFWENLPSYTF